MWREVSKDRAGKFRPMAGRMETKNQATRNTYRSPALPDDSSIGCVATGCIPLEMNNQHTIITLGYSQDYQPSCSIGSEDYDKQSENRKSMILSLLMSVTVNDNILTHPEGILKDSALKRVKSEISQLFDRYKVVSVYVLISNYYQLSLFRLSRFRKRGTKCRRTSKNYETSSASNYKKL